MILISAIIWVVWVLNANKLIAICKQLIDAFFEVVSVLFQCCFTLRFAKSHFHEGFDFFWISLGSLGSLKSHWFTLSNNSERSSITSCKSCMHTSIGFSKIVTSVITRWVWHDEEPTKIHRIGITFSLSRHITSIYSHLAKASCLSSSVWSWIRVNLLNLVYLWSIIMISIDISLIDFVLKV